MFLVTWEYRSSFSTFPITGFAAQIRSDNGTLVPTGAGTSSIAFPQVSAVGSSGHEFLVAGTGNAGLATWTASGAELVQKPIAVDRTANDEQHPSIAACGSSYAVAWHDQRDGDLSIYLDRLGKQNADHVRPRPGPHEMAPAQEGFAHHP